MFSDKYLTLRNKLTTERVREKLEKYGIDINEKTLKTIWFERSFEKRNLKTICGKKIIIYNPGQWNLGDGPDFINAEISVNGKILKGDVEIHLKSSDWELHKHHLDKNYENSIIHVFLIKNTKSPYTFTKSGNKVYQLELSRYLHINSIPVDVEKYPYISKAMLGECGEKISRKMYEKIYLLINYAADARIILKSKEYLQKRDIEQVLYEKIAEALGYAENKESMRELARRLPIKHLMKILRNNLVDKNLTALFFGISNLLPEEENNYDKETSAFIKELNEIWNDKYRKIHKIQMDISSWRFKKVRPLNFPHRRISAFVNILKEILSTGNITEFLISWLRRNIPIIEKNIVRRADIENILSIVKEEEGYFNYRVKFGGKKFTTPKPLIGMEKKIELTVNVFIPFLLYLSRYKGLHEFEPLLFKLFLILPLSAMNRIAKTMGYRLFGPEKIKNLFIKKERFQQGLIQLFIDFCDIRMNCSNCALPVLLENYLDEV